jgi:hypothetical protein
MGFDIRKVGGWGWIADPRTNCSLRYTRPAEPRTPRRCVEVVGIAHGGALAHGPQPHLRLGARAQDRRPPLPPGPLPPQRRHPQAGAGAAGDSGLGADGMGGLGEFSKRLLSHRAGILPNSCFWDLHSFATLGLTLIITRPPHRTPKLKRLRGRGMAVLNGWKRRNQSPSL